MYELAFTTGFSNGLKKFSSQEHILARIQGCLERLKQDPFQKFSNAKRLQGAKARYRVRLGDIRLLYRINSASQRVEVYAVGQRQGVYDKAAEGMLLPPERSDRIQGAIAGRKKPPKEEDASLRADQFASNGGVQSDQDATASAEMVVSEVTEWITEEELGLLDLPEKLWAQVLGAANAEVLPDSIPRGLRDRIESYVTSPASTQLGRLYSLGDDDVRAILHRPLHEFLTALDVEQQRVIQTGLDNGPYLVRGGPGTGKSLIGLHATAAFVRHRRGESLFPESGPPRFGVLTYTNTLSDFNRSLIKHISEGLERRVNIECRTLDKITYDLAKMALGRTPQPRNLSEVTGWMKNKILPTLSTEQSTLVDRLGLDYVVEEIEKVIHDYDLNHLDEYLVIERRGRRIGLTQASRKIIWEINERYAACREADRIDSWQFMRRLALHELMANEHYPRYNALFVDEVQDLSLTSRRLVLNLVREPRHLLLTDDPAQSLYLYPPFWSDVSPNLRFGKGRTFILRRNYRTTREIYRAIEPLRVEADDDASAIGRPMPLFSGPPPTWMDTMLSEHPVQVAEAVRFMNKRYPLGNMGVIVPSHSLVGQYVYALKTAGVNAQAVSQESPIDLAVDAVHVITAHSSKGLEFPVAIVPHVGEATYPARASRCRASGDRHEERDATQRLLYVALSRACRHLLMLTDVDDPSGFEELLDRDQWAISL